MRDDPRIRRLFRLPASESTVARDIDDEITFHIDARTADLIAQGHTPWMMRAVWPSVSSATFPSPGATSPRSTGDCAPGATCGVVGRAAPGCAVRAARHAAQSGLHAVVLTLALGIGVNSTTFGITDRLRALRSR